MTKRLQVSNCLTGHRYLEKPKGKISKEVKRRLIAEFLSTPEKRAWLARSCTQPLSGWRLSA